MRFNRMIILVLSVGLITSLVGNFNPVASVEKVRLECYVLANRQELEAEKRATALFEQMYPNIDIEIVHPAIPEYYNKLRILAGTGMLPDLMRITSEEFQSFAVGGALLNLLPLVEKERERNPYFATQWEDFHPKLLKPFYYKGFLYGFPRDWNDATIFYNEKLFDEAGLDYPKEDWTIDDFVNLAKALTKDIDGDGRIDQYGHLLTGDWFDSILPWIYTFGGKVLDDKWEKCIANTPETIAALQFMGDLVSKYKVSPAPELVAADAPFSGIRGWMTGRIAMAHYGRYMVPAFREIEDFGWNCQAQPFGPQGIRGVPYGVGGQCISSDTKYPEEAFQYAAFISGPIVQEMWDKIGTSIQVLKSIIYREDYLHPQFSPKNQGIMVEALDYARHIPGPPGYHEIVRIACSETERVLLGERTAENAARNMSEEINKVFAEIGKR